MILNIAPCGATTDPIYMSVWFPLRNDLCFFCPDKRVGCLHCISHANITLFIRNRGKQRKTWLHQLLTSEPNYTVIIKQVVL